MGGVDEVLDEVQRDYPEVDVLDLKRELVRWRLEQKAKEVIAKDKAVVEKSPRVEKEEDTSESSVEEEEDLEKEKEVEVKVKVTPTAKSPVPKAAAPKKSSVPHPEPQMRFKNRIVTAYRSAEGKICVKRSDLS